MNVLQVIEQREILGKQLTMYGDFEEPLFLAKEVANWIDYSESNVSKLVAMVDEEEKVRNIITTLGGNQEMWFLTEDGLYEVLMQSRKPIAKQFKKEVKALLKNIRKGMFSERYISGTSQYSIEDIVRETICQVVPIIIKELEDRTEREKQAEKEMEKLEIKAKRKIERLICAGNHSYSSIARILTMDGIEISPATVCFYAESMGIMD